MSWSELHTDYIRVGPKFPCPICGKTDGCLVHKSGEHVICYHVQSTKLWKIGFLHRVPHGKAIHIADSISCSSPPGDRVTPNFVRLQEIYQGGITKNQVCALSTQLGVAQQSLIELGIGWSNTHKVYTFPVRDETCQIVGIQTRDQDGNKKMIQGSTSGVFIPSRFLESRAAVYITEGVSDTCAAETIGLNVIGRFNAVSCTEILTNLLIGMEKVYVIADNDGPGLRGAAELRDAMRKVTKFCGMIVLPLNVKDLRVALNTLGCINTLNIIWKQVQE